MLLDAEWTSFFETTFYGANRMTQPPPPIKPPPQVKPLPKRIAPKAAPSQPARVPKTFSVAAWTGAGEGEKIIAYGPSGAGKTTLAALAPAPLFIGLDDGGRKIRNAITGEPVSQIKGVITFDDFRDSISQKNLFDGFKTVVIDTGTILEILAGEWTCQNIPHEKGTRVNRLVDYGYGKGYEHLFDTMRLAFQDLDSLVRRGLNVLVLCQQCPIVVANAAGANYLENGPKLYAPGPDSKATFTVRGFACEWADHVIRIDYLNRNVVGGGSVDGKERAGKVKGDTTRAVYTMPTDPSFFAKTRTLTEPVISFDSPADDSFWKYLFPEEEQA
jgi:hypothetical protein